MSEPSVRFVPDHAGMAAILRSDEVRELVLDRARAGAEFAQHIAPRRTGEYAEGIHAEDGGLGGPRQDRAVALIVATSPHSAAVEWGNAHQPHPYHVLGRTLDVVQSG